MTENFISSKIKELRAVMSLTREQFAAKVGVTSATVNRWEAGEAKPSRLALMRLQEFEQQSQRDC